MTLEIIPFLQRLLDIICIIKIKIVGFPKHSFSPGKIIPFQLCLSLRKKN